MSTGGEEYNRNAFCWMQMTLFEFPYWRRNCLTRLPCPDYRVNRPIIACSVCKLRAARLAFIVWFTALIRSLRQQLRFHRTKCIIPAVEQFASELHHIKSVDKRRQQDNRGNKPENFHNEKRRVKGFSRLFRLSIGCQNIGCTFSCWLHCVWR